MEKIHSQFHPRCTGKIREKRSSLAGVEVVDAVTDLLASSRHQAAIVTITEQFVTIAIVVIIGAIVTCNGGREAGGSRERNLVGCSLSATSGN
uniref:Uncharacterized protein n=1 Tax=Oryza glumipatula TaxID=40148 RepID=A0A0D9YQF5_9ORYZ